MKSVASCPPQQFTLKDFTKIVRRLNLTDESTIGDHGCDQCDSLHLISSSGICAPVALTPDDLDIRHVNSGNGNPAVRRLRQKRFAGHDDQCVPLIDNDEVTHIWVTPFVRLLPTALIESRHSHIHALCQHHTLNNGVTGDGGIWAVLVSIDSTVLVQQKLTYRASICRRRSPRRVRCVHSVRHLQQDRQRGRTRGNWTICSANRRPMPCRTR